MNYKFILASAIFGLGLTTQVDAQEQQTKRGKTNVRTLASKLSNQVLGMQYSGLALQKGESPLATERRIVKQQILDGEEEDMSFKYGYAGNNYGMQFHNSFFIGFPTTINATKVDEIFLNYNAVNPDNLNSFYYPSQSGANVMADTITTLYGGIENGKNYVMRGTNLAVNSWFSIEDNGMGQDIIQQENIYNANGKVERMNNYSGSNLAALQLETVRKIGYNTANNRVETDTTEYLDAGTVEFVEVLNYEYNNNGKLVKVKYIDTDYPGDSAVFHFSYDNNGYYSKMKASSYEDGDILPYGYTDSITYDNGTNLASRSVFIEWMGSIQGYTVALSYNNNNRLDTVKQTILDEGISELAFVAKYHYSVDNNPDSLVAYDGADPTLVIGKMNFYYENYNTTSVNNLVRNNNFEVFPVPVNGNSFNLNSKVALKNKNATITVMNINGAKIFSTTRTLNDGVNTINIPTDLAAGNYIVEVIADNSVFTQKISKL